MLRVSYILNKARANINDMNTGYKALSAYGQWSAWAELKAVSQ